MTLKVSLREFTFQGQQRTKSLGFHSDAPFPLALRAETTQDQVASLQDYVDALRELSSSGKLTELVREHGGAVLIRGLPIENAQDYSELAHAFGFQAHEEVGRPPKRTVLAKNIKTANEGCGETPINSSIQLANEVKRRAPEFYQKLLERGVRYVYRYGKEDVVSTTGTSVYGAYGQNVADTDDENTARQKIEEEVKRHSNSFTWNDDGSLTVTHTTPLIRIHNDTGLATWFGNITSAWGRSVHHGATEPPFRGDDGSYHPPPLYGNGEEIERQHLDLALEIAESSQVLVKWEKGDLVLLDNIAVMHSRRAWIGQRQVLAALWDDQGRVDDYPEGEEILKDKPRKPILVESVECGVAYA
ncbi:Taurine catabolism dioxygenase TauD, TfdA family [Geosmithia morbida]|uniref:Taurine catabolism dioxygenase TauD, TfdA family n=1 Tax=Geosmithia morbida TaxID=1094350 RepID=A0A9P5D439_9HYPO|nr:Taurine catabolism dioxygenase TauD, TfdA family [Geosmithia morbida]KAF4123121.1 Taurine catabolism dioxygenase TauD, TfdA family [Geosmithia morbida]